MRIVIVVVFRIRDKGGDTRVIQGQHLADELEGHLVGHNGGVAVGDISEGAGVNKHWCLLHCLRRGEKG